jgi:hypothetical protein
MAGFSERLDEIERGLTAPTPLTSRLDELERMLPKTSSVVPQEEAAPAPLDFSKMNYSELDLTKDEFYRPIEDYMSDRFGAHMKEYDRNEVVEMFTNNMRGFAGGNSVRSINEITYLNELGEDEERLAKVGKAYELYDNMQGLFGDTTKGEKVEVVWDFAKSAIVDPVNILSLGVGKVITGTGFKAGSRIAYIAAKQAYQKKLAQGATAEVANTTAQRVFRAQAARATTETNKRIAQRQAVEAAATTTLQRMTTGVALKQAAAVGTFEAAVAAGTDYLWQDAMLRTKVQEEYSTFQTGLSAVVGLVAGGLAGATSNIGTGAAKTVAPTALKTSTKGSNAIAKLVVQTPTGTPSPPAGNWLADIAKGKELQDQDTEFFVTMLLGNDEKGLKGLAQILAEDGYAWVRRTPDDKVSNWVGDIIKRSDPQDAKKFLDDFSRETGIDMVEGKTLTIDQFADTFKRKMSDSGKVLNAASQAAKVLGRNANSVTADEYAQFVLGGGLPLPASSGTNAMAKVGKAAGNLINRDLPDFQNNIIRLMVSNLSTTALNVTGYSAATALNSASDVVRAALLGGKAGVYMVYNPTEAKRLGIDALSILRNQKQKALNTLDVNTTYDTFLKYSQVRPDALRGLTAVLPGGVESLEKLAKNFDPDKPLMSLRMDQAVDYVQRINLVSAQDGYTKSIEFLTQMDGLLRRSKEDGGFGMSWNQFFSRPDHHALMISERFVNLEAKAVNETLRAVFSKSYKGKDFIGEVAGIIEDARNLPGIGLLVPFGRFFNNTVAMTYNMTAIGPLLARPFKEDPEKMTSELFARGVVSWTLIGTLAAREMEFIDKGLGWSEEIDDDTGDVIDERYEFPYGAYKAIARLVAHQYRGEEIPAELIEQMGDQFIGQLTRQLGEAGGGVSEIAKSLLSDEGPELSKILMDSLGAVASQGISGMTRPLEPINVAVGLARDEEFFVPDRKQGTKWLNNSLRYMDQMVAVVRGENWMPEMQSAAEGKPRVQASRLVSTTRASELTNTERVMNIIGRPAYKASMASQSEAADNRYNQIFNQIVEEGSGRLFDSKRFKEGSLEVRQGLVGKLLEDARKSTKVYMGRVAENSDDDALVRMLDISSYSKIKVRNTIKDLGFDKPLDELSVEELETLGLALRFREEYLGIK